MLSASGGPFRGRLASAASVLLLAVVACARVPPNVLLVTFDTVRYDRFGYTGDKDARTPTVDALAARGLAFDQAYASAPLTLPSHVTMLTGLEPFAHGVHNNGYFQLPDDVVTLEERLQAAGYRTAAFVSSIVLHSRHKLDRGFDVYDDEMNSEGSDLDSDGETRPGEETTDAAITWLDHGRDAARPFFLWVHYYDSHHPYHAPPPYDAIPDKYRASIAFSDAELGRLLDKVAAVEGKRGTLVVFTSDHGESLGEHGEATHGWVAYDATLHVPLIVSGRGVPRGVRSPALVGHVDLMPTVLEAAGLRVPRELAGRSLAAAARDVDRADDAPVRYFECEGAHYLLGWQSIAGVRTAGWKYTAAPLPAELYDVRSDPHELRNLADSEPDVRAKMDTRWSEFERLRAQPRPAAELKSTSLETMEQLAALGYVQAPQTFPAGESPDPRKFVAMRAWIENTAKRALEGQPREAIAELEAMAGSASIRALVLRNLAPLYAKVGRLGDAIRTYEEYIDLTHEEEGKVGLARTLLKAGRPADALALLEGLEHGDASTPVALRAVVLARLGRQQEARALVDAKLGGVERLHRRASIVLESAPLPDGEVELRRLLSEAPEDATLKSALGYYLAVWGRSEQAEEALALLKSAATARPRNAELHANLGWGAYRLGRYDEAIAELGAALRINRSRALDRFRLALALVRGGRASEALAVLREAVAAQPAARWAKKCSPLIAALEASRSAPKRDALHASVLHELERAAD